MTPVGRRSRPRAAAAIAGAALVGMTLAANSGQQSLEALSTTDPALTATVWAPGYAEVVTSNNNSVLGQGAKNVTYRVQWQTARNATLRNMSSPYWTQSGNQGTIEIGLKNTGIPDCNNSPDGVLRIGFPSTVPAVIDGTEDNQDAIAWISNLPALRADQIANLFKKYSIAWRCTGSLPIVQNGRFDSDPGAFEVQLGSWSGIRAPETTYSRATLNYVPPENKYRLVPSAGATYGPTTSMYAPWLEAAGFENATSLWQSSSAFTNRFVGPANNPLEGNAYMLVQPPTGGLLVQPTAPFPHSYLIQTFKVMSFNEQGRLLLGSNTDYAFEGNFRCPSWSPSWSLKGGTTCPVTIWLKTPNHPSWAQNGFTYQIPADGRWYFVSQDPWGAQTTDDDVTIWIDSNGYALDVDDIWVTSGY